MTIGVVHSAVADRDGRLSSTNIVHAGFEPLPCSGPRACAWEDPAIGPSLESASRELRAAAAADSRERGVC
jgi:hypothetical protein